MPESGPYTRLVVILIRPSKYDDEGYVIRHFRGTLPSNTLSCLNSLTEDAVRRGVDYLLREQEPDGSWWGRWGVNYVYGAGAALPALEAAGFPPDHPALRGGVAWLQCVPSEDGGFGEDCRS